MGGIRSLGDDQFSPPVVPFPYQSRIACEGLRRGKVFRPKISPQAVGPAESRHAAVGRNAGTGQDSKRPRRRNFISDKSEIGGHGKLSDVDAAACTWPACYSRRSVSATY